MGLHQKPKFACPKQTAGAVDQRIEGLGIGAVERHVRSLAARVRDGIRELGLELVTPSDPAAYSAITVFSAGSPEAGQELLQKLLDDRVLASVRYTSGVGGIRVSTHYFNDESDVDALLDSVRRHRPGVRAEPRAQVVSG